METTPAPLMPGIDVGGIVSDLRGMMQQVTATEVTPQTAQAAANLAAQIYNFARLGVEILKARKRGDL